MWNLKSLHLEGTSIVGQLPSFVVPNYQRTTAFPTLEGVSVLCPQLDFNTTRDIVVDPLFYGYFLCQCRRDYAGFNGICLPCPTPGGHCSNGTEFRVAPGFWCDTSRYEAHKRLRHCAPCFPGYCCSNPEACPIARQCTTNRQGVLCGECTPGTSVAFGTAACVDATGKCDALTWLVPVVLILSGLGSLACVMTFRPNYMTVDSRFQVGLHGRHMLVVFYQVAPLVSQGMGQDRFNRLVAAIFNADVDSSVESENGICLAPKMTSIDKVAFNSLLPACLALWTIVFLVCERVARRMGRRMPNVHQGIIRLALFTLTIGYTAILQTSFRLLYCIEVEGQLALQVMGSVKCFAPWQRAMVLLVVLLATVPVLLGLWLNKQLNCQHYHGLAVESLLAPFHDNRRLWPAVLLTERLVFSVLFCLMSEQHRPWALFNTGSAILLMHIFFRPYKQQILQTCDFLLLVVVVTLASFGIAKAILTDSGVEQVSDRLQTLGVVANVLRALPLTVFGTVLGVCLIWDLIRPKQSHNLTVYWSSTCRAQPTDLNMDDDDESVELDGIDDTVVSTAPPLLLPVGQDNLATSLKKHADYTVSNPSTIYTREFYNTTLYEDTEEATSDDEIAIA